MSFMTIVKPLLAVAFAMALVVVGVNERYMPRNAQWAKQMRNERFRLEKVAKADDIVYRNAKADRTWSIDEMLDERGEHLRNVRVAIDRPGGGRLANVSAAQADYLDGEWWFTDPKVQHYDAHGQETATVTPELDSLPFRAFPQFNERPSDFLVQNRDWQYNSVRDRFRYLRTHPDLGGKDRQELLYDTWAQIMAPWACVLITLIAIPAGIASGRQSVFKGILGALGLYFVFYGLTILCMVVAKCGWCPAIIAAVLPDVVFLVLGIRAFRRQR